MGTSDIWAWGIQLVKSHTHKTIFIFTLTCSNYLLLAYFQYPPPPRKRKRKIQLQCFIVHWAFYFVLNTMIYCWTCMKTIGTITLSLICLLLFIKDWIIYFMHCLLLLKYAANSKVHVILSPSYSRTSMG